MKNVTSAELRAMFLRFFQERGHAVIASASVIPENDPTVLFTTAGMHPLVPYLLGAKHPEGTRLTDVQKCIRTGDIDEVGDALGGPPAEDGPEGVGQGLLPVVVGVDEGAVGLGLVGGAGRVDGLDDLVVVAEDGGVLDVAGVGGGGLGLVRGLDEGLGRPVALHVGEQGHDVGVGAA